LNDFQRDFPLTAEPFREVARQLGTTQGRVLGALCRLAASGAVSRVGAVIRPGSLGASTLGAMSVPAPRLAGVARIVSSQPEVNHNYEREHRLNLWFVAAGEDSARLDAALSRIERESGLEVISLPLVTDYYIDLGFPLEGASAKAGVADRAAPCVRRAPPLSPRDRALMRALQDGLPLVPKPFGALAQRAGWHAAGAAHLAIERIEAWLDDGTIKRFGIVVRHRALGFTANAMCAWDVPDDRVDRLGLSLAREAATTLCYRRARAGAAWPFNLFCMVHGRDRGTVEQEVQALGGRVGLEAYPGAVLFSRRAFKQRGACYVAPAKHAHG
jgi:DNA-binding Lrp family transcriptional regulator